MSDTAAIAGHYTSGTLMDRLKAVLSADGHDPEKLTLDALAPYDHFHGRGLEATVELADGLKVSSEDNILDVGCGIGGPARYIADRFGCHVKGIDLTAEFCEVGRALNEQLSLADLVTIEQGNALQMPFEDQSFNGAYSMNVSMNIEDKDGLYKELHRVLKPRGWLVLSEVARGSGAEPDYPTPWADTASESFLATVEETHERLTACGFEVQAIEDKIPQSRAFAAKVKEMVERGEKSPHRAVQLIHGEMAKAAMDNMVSASREGRILPVEVMCVRA